MPLPRLSLSFVRCREVGRRNRRIAELGLGWRYAVQAGDDATARETERKIMEQRQRIKELAP